MSWAMIGAAGITAAGSIAGGMMSKGGGDTEYIPYKRTKNCTGLLERRTCENSRVTVW